MCNLKGCSWEQGHPFVLGSDEVFVKVGLESVVSRILYGIGEG